MPWRGIAPVQLVIAFVGVVLLICTGGIIVLAVMNVQVPDALGTLSIASMTALGGLLAPNTGLVSGKTARRADAAARAAATAVMAAEQDDEQHAAELDLAAELGNSHRGM